ncbi:NADH-ubiquinone oxidoreductase chain H, partial [hydrothermal vent metagenome]
MILDQIWLVIWTLIKIVAIVLPLIIVVAYLTYAERRVIGFMQGRMGPNRVGVFGFKLWGLAQPFADTVKLLLKEIIFPANANKFLFLMAPVITLATAFAAWAVVPFSDGLVLADINAGLIYIL